MQKNVYNDKLFDAVLKIAAEEALEQEMEEMPSCEELNEQYKPSPSLEKNIRKKLSRHKFKEKAMLYRKTAVKVAACITVVLVSSSILLLSADATRNYIFNAVIKWQEDHFSIQHDGSIESDKKILSPTYLPEGFTEVSIEVIGNIINITYENENGITIEFEQSPSKSTNLLVDNEDKEHEEIEINGHKAYLFITIVDDKSNTLLWEVNGVFFCIISEVEKDELILIAESIK